MRDDVRLMTRTPEGDGRCPRIFTLERAQQTQNFHRSFPGYRPTPLVRLRGLAEKLGVGEIWVKDESKRFDLNAFKVLGGSWCMGRYIAGRLGLDPGELTYQTLTGRRVREALGQLTFVTATDGNHGRGIAWTARQLGQKSVVYLPRGSAPERVENIRALGAEAFVTGMDYDDTVRFARAQAEKEGWVLVQDTSWEGYEEIPTWIMEGYTTMGWEMAGQLQGQRPTHLFLQAGVGAMAGAMAGFFAGLYGEDCPAITVVEPREADCLFRTAEAGDGALHRTKGSMETIMAGLCCGEPCGVGWEQLRARAGNYAAVSDAVAARGMRILGLPLPGDPQVISGESGAATVGFLAAAAEDRSLGERLGLDKTSRVLCISTEGDTDRENYRRIVWEGAFSQGDA